MNSKKLVSALLAALSSVSLSGGSLSFAAARKPKNGNNTVERIKRSKSRKLKTAKRDGLGEDSSEVKKIEENLNRNAPKGVSYKVVRTVGGLVAFTIIAGIGVVGYKKFKSHVNKNSEDLKEKPEYQNKGKDKVLDSDGDSDSGDDESVSSGVEDKDNVKEKENEFEKGNANEKVENGGKLFEDQNKGKDKVLDSDDDEVDNDVKKKEFKNDKKGEYSCPKNVGELKGRINNKWKNVKDFIDAALKEGMSDIEGRKLFVKTADVDDAVYYDLPKEYGNGISFLYDDWKFGKGGFLGWDMISSGVVSDLFF